MLDVLLNPGWLRSAVSEMNDILHEIYEELWQFVQPEVVGVEGSLDYCGCWSPGRALAFDADMAYGVGDKPFRELMLPPLVEWMSKMDHVIWHLDGPGNLNHLDTLLALPEVDAIQWVPGSGKQDVLQYISLIQKIQRAGKSVQVACRPAEVEPLLREVSPAGITMWVYDCETEAEARRLLERVTRMYA